MSSACICSRCTTAGSGGARGENSGAEGAECAHRAEWLVLVHSPTLALTHALTHAHACALLSSLAQAWAAAFSFMKDRHLDVAHSGDAGSGESDDDTNEPPAVRGEQKCVPSLSTVFSAVQAMSY